jgi:hypothetical protein
MLTFQIFSLEPLYHKSEGAADAGELVAADSWQRDWRTFSKGRCMVLCTVNVYQGTDFPEGKKQGPPCTVPANDQEVAGRERSLLFQALARGESRTRRHSDPY